MKYWLLAIALAAIAPPVHAAPTIRGLFVGVDKYQFSRTHVPYSRFSDLNGAVGDVSRIKAALRQAYSLDLDTRAADQCESKNAVSVTLTDNCATRAAIVDAITSLIATSQRGDTIIFYYAGHGSRVYDDQEFDQASGWHDTIMPTDSRDPSGASRGEILDTELRNFIDAATAKGINFLTIFDSCDSGTGVRRVNIPIVTGHARGVRDEVVHGIKLGPAMPVVGKGGGYRVHLAAAKDGTFAFEIPSADGKDRGVFTSALAKTLLAMPDATYDDIATETRLAMEGNGRKDQEPQAEGDLNARLGGPWRKAALFGATPAADGVELDGGRLSGVTTGSRFALFGSSSDALSPATQPIATATVAETDTSSARLRLDAPPAGKLPARLVARETSHAFGDLSIALSVFAPRAADRQQVEAALAPLKYVRVEPSARFLLAARPPDSGGGAKAELFNIDGSWVANLGVVDDPDFPLNVSSTFQKILRVDTLLALRTGTAQPDTSLCISNTLDYDPFDCPSADRVSAHALARDVPAKLTVTYNGDKPRNVYVFGIDPQFGVTMLIPRNNGIDPPVKKGTAQQRDLSLVMPGTYRFVTIATDAPINAAVLQQSGVGTRGAGSCQSALERLLCDAGSGTRDPSAARVGDWTARVDEVIVPQGD